MSRERSGLFRVVEATRFFFMSRCISIWQR
nr:MAG TPA: hypothetical protein [Herelleviridae sp.]